MLSTLKLQKTYCRFDKTGSLRTKTILENGIIIYVDLWRIMRSLNPLRDLLAGS